jgi:hypothetical protein
MPWMLWWVMIETERSVASWTNFVWFSRSILTSVVSDIQRTKWSKSDICSTRKNDLHKRIVNRSKFTEILRIIGTDLIWGGCRWKALLLGGLHLKMKCSWECSGFKLQWRRREISFLPCMWRNKHMVVFTFWGLMLFSTRLGRCVNSNFLLSL